MNGVTLWDVGVEKQIQIKGPDAFDLTNMIVPRDLHKCAVDQCKYVFISAPDGGILNDPVLLRVAEDEFWLSLADSDVNLYALGIAAAKGMDVAVREIDVAPVQIQGPDAKGVLVDLFGERVLDVPYYGLMKDNPFEVGYHYTWMVDLDQEADFMGKEALKRIKAEGVRQRLVGVDIDGGSLGSYRPEARCSSSRERNRALQQALLRAPISTRAVVGEAVHHPTLSESVTCAPRAGDGLTPDRPIS